MLTKTLNLKEHFGITKSYTTKYNVEFLLGVLCLGWWPLSLKVLQIRIFSSFFPALPQSTTYNHITFYILIGTY